jgi:diguanylate cyclase (GGDEF)-like protein
VAATEHPSLRRLSLFSASWYVSVLGGWTLLGLAIRSLCGSSITTVGAPLIMTSALLVFLELRPMIQGRGHDPQGVVMSTAFVSGMLFLWGPWPVVVAISVASIAADLRAGKSRWKVLFNVGQYNVSVGLASVVMFAAGRHPTLGHPLPSFAGSDLPWVVGVWVVYFVVNDLLVSGVLAWTDSFRGVLLDDFWNYAATTFSVLALSPVVVIVAQTEWVMLPLLLIPLLLIYKTAQMSLEKEYQAAHDSLTGLPNRTSLQASLIAALARSKRDSRPFGLMVIDLDHFKEVNDTLGHHVGDQLLMNFAERLMRSVRPTDHVSRLGGDEFAVIVPEATESQVRSIADRIRRSLLEPVVLDGVLFEIEASIGVAMHPEHGAHADDLLRLADVAMYVAKESRIGVVTYSAQRDRNSTNRLSLLGELRQALDEDALELHYQPKIAVHDYSLLGMEALVRWNHAERGYIPPDDFIPLAERSGIMHLLTGRVISLAMSQMAEWRKQGLHVPVAVNVSLADLIGGRLPALLSAELRKYSLPAGMLQLEITERVVAQQVDELGPVLQELDRMGVTLSLDDFGTGYSSLLRLQSLPVDELKIDRAFVARMSDGEAAVGIVRAFVDLAHALGMPAIAEGVETQAEWKLLRALGCDGGQGWHIARPMPPALATEWLRNHESAVAAAAESIEAAS